MLQRSTETAGAAATHNVGGGLCGSSPVREELRIRARLRDGLRLTHPTDHLRAGQGYAKAFRNLSMGSATRSGASRSMRTTRCARAGRLFRVLHGGRHVLCVAGAFPERFQASASLHGTNVISDGAGGRFKPLTRQFDRWTFVGDQSASASR